ncbi:MAG: PD-(D/E)XK nuclease family protein [Actinomycetota bacterium]
MSVEWHPNRLRVVRDLLGWDESLRPRSPAPSNEPDLADRVRAELEERLWPLARRHAQSGRNLYASKHRIAAVLRCEGSWVAPDEFTWSIPVARGRLVHKAIEMTLTARRGELPPMELVDIALTSLKSKDDGLSDYLNQCDPGSESELVADSSNLLTTFLNDFPPINARMTPRIECSVRVDLCDGTITLAGKYDLALGRPGQDPVSIVDLKSGDEHQEHMEDLRFYALLELLKTGVPPVMIGSYYLNSSTPRSQPVDEGTIESASRRTVDAISRMAQLEFGERDADLSPGSYCSFCSALPECKQGQDWLEEGRKQRKGSQFRAPSPSRRESSAARTP